MTDQNKNSKYNLVALVFTVGYILYYFSVVWLALSDLKDSFKGLMHFNFFLNQVVFIVALIAVILNKISNKKIKYGLLLLLAIILTTIYVLAYKEVSFFIIVSSILIYLGLILSGTAIVKSFLIIKQKRI